MNPVPLLLVAGCTTVVEPSDDSGAPEPEPTAAPAIAAVGGIDAVLIHLDRSLEPGERVERLGGAGDWSSFGASGEQWIDGSPSSAYRWTDGERAAVARPQPFQLRFEASDGPLLYAPDDSVERAVAWEGPELPEGELSLHFERERDGAWLVADHPEARWGTEPTAWAVVESSDDATTVSWPSDATEPTLERVWASLRFTSTEGEITLAAATASDVHTGRRWAWGDLHAHTNLSMDGCEDPDNSCLPRGERPSADVYFQAERVGLDFLAVTDHAEFEGYERPESGQLLDIHAETTAAVAAAEGGPVVPIAAYEWTGAYSTDDGGRAGGHRTVIFEELEPCEAFWVGANSRGQPKAAFGLEHYIARERLHSSPDELLAALDEAALDCGSQRYLSWFHHPALDTPQPVDWSLDLTRGLGDRLVEIQSEHGSSECDALEDDGCAWRVNSGLHIPWGSVRTALAEGHALGFIGATDSHQALPGDLVGGPSAIARSHDSEGNPLPEGYKLLFGPGAVTGLLRSGEALDRSIVFDALEARSTVAASWIFDELRVAALGADGEVYLPGSDVPTDAVPLQLLAQVEHDLFDTWRMELWDPWGELWAESDEPSLHATMDLAPGEVRYLRIRAWAGEDEERVWVSPWFGTD